jgi:hypothetical protein
MSSARINKRLALCAFNKASRSCRLNWYFHVRSYYGVNDLHLYTSFIRPIPRSFAKDVEIKTLNNCISIWYNKIKNVVGPYGRGHNKLQVFSKFKTEYKV